MFVDAPTAALLESAQAHRAANYAHAVEPKPGIPAPAVSRISGAQVVYAGPNLPVNRAIGLGMTGPVTHDDIDAVEAFYRPYHIEPLIDLCPLADATLFAVLAARGYRPLRAMTLLIVPPLPHTLPTDSDMPAKPAANRLTVTRAQPPEHDRWLDLSARGFSNRDTDSDTVDPDLLALLTPNVRATNASAYFAWLDDRPIATGGLYQHGPVAELGGASTLPAYRRHGAQTALIAQRLTDAAAAGCRYAIVLTTPGSDSQRNLQRRGFSVAYTRFICAAPAT